MALPASDNKACIELSDIDRGIYETFEIRIHPRAAAETRELSGTRNAGQDPPFPIEIVEDFLIRHPR